MYSAWACAAPALPEKTHAVAQCKSFEALMIGRSEHLRDLCALVEALTDFHEF